MTDPDDVDLDDAAIRLASRLVRETMGDDGATIMSACCWILAERVRDAKRAHGATPEKALALVVAKVTEYLEYLNWIDETAGEVDGPRH
jgi:hypothetical protein